MVPKGSRRSGMETDGRPQGAPAWQVVSAPLDLAEITKRRGAGRIALDAKVPDSV
jgi:hypothetical protein